MDTLMKTRFLLLVALAATLISTTSSFGQWNNLDQTAAFSSIYGMSFINPNVGYAVGGDGTIIATSDGGTNWEAINAGLGVYLFAVKGIDANTWYVAGEGGLFMKTTDDGLNWDVFPTMTVADLRDFTIIDNRTFVVAGGSGFVAMSTDAGMTWTPMNSGASTSVNSVHFLSKTKGFIVGGDMTNGATGFILKTENGGSTWTPTLLGIPAPLTAVRFATAQKGYAIGWKGLVYTTSDGGTTWVAGTMPVNANLNAISVVDANTAYCVGDDALASTTDGGQTWKPQTPATVASWYSVAFPTKSVGYTGGDFGLMMKTMNGGVGTGTLPLAPKSVVLHGNYPNPFNPSTRLSWTVNLPGRVIVKVYSMNGREVATLADEFQSPGTYTRTFAAEGLASGAYVCVLRASGTVITRKMVLAR